MPVPPFQQRPVLFYILSKFTLPSREGVDIGMTGVSSNINTIDFLLLWLFFQVFSNLDFNKYLKPVMHFPNVKRYFQMHGL